MKIGQTSLVVFISKVVGSALGFLATIYFARTLGAEVLGLYAMVIAIVNWLQIGGSLGFSEAVTKRLSEGEDRGKFLVAGVGSVGAVAVVLSVVVVLARPVFERYLSDFSAYAPVSVVWFVVLLLFANLFYALIRATLEGARLVHVSGFLAPLKIGSQSVIQVTLVVLGPGLAGMLLGYGLGGILIGTVGLLYITVPVGRPDRSHFLSLFEYAKYSWIGSLKSRTFSEVDILLLGVFVQTGLVGVYAVAWSLANFLKLFGKAVSETLFPEISHLSAQDRREAAAGLVEESLTYGGLVALPGLVGGVVLADRLLAIYGEEFVRGTAVLGLLISSVLLYTYQRQMLTALNALDRPDITFRINIAFIGTNIVLNALFIWWFGWVGAAVATVIATSLGLTLAYVALDRLVPFRTPVEELGRQVVAALFMGVVVQGARELIQMSSIPDYNAPIVVALVALGGGVYFLTLFGISSEFRTTVERNLPFDVPVLSG